MSGRILVIKLGALGDFVQALGPFKAIRDHHKHAHIVLLTTRPFRAFAEETGLFDEVWLDDRPALKQIGKVLALRRRLKSGRFERVYDLQTSDRSSFYFKLFWPGKRPEWSGIAGGCSHPHDNPARDSMHTVERQAEQLATAGISNVPPPDLSWVKRDLKKFDLPRRYALLVPGGAAHRPAKRWPADNYAALGQWLVRRSVTPVLIGNEEELHEQISANCRNALSLAGRTDFMDIAAIAQNARCAVGNDTGPMHIITAAGCKSVVLFSNESDPDLCGQRGPDVQILREGDMRRIAVADVAELLKDI